MDFISTHNPWRRRRISIWMLLKKRNFWVKPKKYDFSFWDLFTVQQLSNIYKIHVHYIIRFFIKLPGADHILHKIWRGVVLHLLHRLKRFNLYEREKTPAFRSLAGQTNIRLRLQNFLREPMKVAEISGVLFASCSNVPKRGKKWDEFKSLYRNILKLLFCGHISLLQRKTTPLQIPSHMGKRYAIWRRFRIGSALVRVRQPICSKHSAMGHIYSTAKGSKL